MDRTSIVQNKLLDFLDSYQADRQVLQSDPSLLVDLFKSQIQSRLLDYQGRHLKSKNEGFYTIGSAGHEGNAVFGGLLKKSDPCLLHYRSGAFMLARAKRLGYSSMVKDTLLSFCASKHDPTSGGRHKVWGNKTLWVPPQTSTIASHLPKAVGMSFGIARAHHNKIDASIDADSIVFVNFGDASCNHATAQTAFNAASWSAYQKLPTPIFFLCEDNGFGISVRTPQGWIASQMKARPEIEYFYADGCNLDQTIEEAQKAIAYCRERRKPVFFHLKTIRLFGHAGSDVETAYRSIDEIRQTEDMDPLIQSAKQLIDAGLMKGVEIREYIEHQINQMQALALEAIQTPKLETVQEITKSLYNDSKLVQTLPEKSKRQAHFEKSLGHLPEESPKPRHMAMLMNWALQDAMVGYDEMVMFGEDVAKKGGVYHVTHSLASSFGTSRVFNTLLDETTILGLAIGMSQVGFLPVPEIQYLAYYHNAQDQVRSEAASQSFFSDGQFTNPMVVRIASFGYQKGFGGHFHNDNSLAALLDVPGLLIVSPSRGDDAVEMFLKSLTLAKSQGRVVLFLEPIALYMQKDLHQVGDGQWLFDYPKAVDATDPILPRVYEEDAKDLLIISYANGLHMSLQAAKVLKEKHHVDAAVMDLRQLKPLQWDEISKYVQKYEHILVVDECRSWGGISDRLISTLMQREEFTKKRFHCVQAHDTYVPLGPAANKVIPQVADIIEKSVSIVGKR